MGMAKGNPQLALSLNVVLIVIVCMLVSAPGPRNGIEAAVTCSQVRSWVSPCLSYAIYGGTVAPECCAGLVSLNAASITTQDRRNACSCLIDGVGTIPGIDYDLVAALPQKCSISSPYQISPSTDCSKIN